ncbi:hypothetical protein ABH920_007238 [Catenulispora sp. EB89]|uniref:SCO2522 family protein n=1 Tax=Catenulispora sp. EB89 TaxID=3156257 RepID=UPI0035146E6E
MVTYTSSQAAEPPAPVFSEHHRDMAVKQLSLSHLSVEVGHFYMEDLEGDEEPILTQFERVKPWLEAAKASVISGDSKPRVSTCFLIDDYFQSWPDAPEIMERLLRLSMRAGVTIDYVARESACARRKDGFAVAELLATRLLEEPEPDHDTGGRPPTIATGWLSNGRPARQATILNAMEAHTWEAPLEYGKRNHSIYVDVELWRDDAEPGADREDALSRRQYSCPFLAAVWQLVRLGLLRKDGIPALEVTDFDGEWKAEWSHFPDIIKVNPNAAPFYAYQSLSIMPQNFLPIETAVRNIVDHFVFERDVMAKLDRRAQQENVSVPDVISQRMSHHFLPGGK